LFLFILESIGTPELILIAIVALIVFGPRKLPQMMKTVGKTMAEFRNATNEFKTTWEKEVREIENEFKDKPDAPSENPVAVENTIAQNTPQEITENHLPKPEVKELSAEEFSKNFPNSKSIMEENQPVEIKTEKKAADKRDWL
jgi:sec-independent protein translocase protein TatA